MKRAQRTPDADCSGPVVAASRPGSHVSMPFQRRRLVRGMEITIGAWISFGACVAAILGVCEAFRRGGDDPDSKGSVSQRWVAENRVGPSDDGSR